MSNNQRYKDIEWEVDATYQGVTVAVLMDLRDELKRLNRILYCENFLAIPRKLDAIQKNTTKRKRRK